MNLRIERRALYWLLAGLTYAWIPVSHFLLSVPWVFPRLQSWKSEPAAWVAAEWAPLVLGLLVLGWLSSIRMIVIHALVIAVVSHLFGMMGAMKHWPGMGKSDAVENPFAYWTAELLLLLILLTIPMLSSRAIQSRCARVP